MTQVNNTRKQVFDYIRNNSEYTRTDFRKTFGNSKSVLAAEAEAIERVAGNSCHTISEQFAAKIKGAAAGLASCLPESGYSMGEMTHIYVKHLGIVSTCDRTAEYAKSCKFRATHGEVTVTMGIREVIGAENLSGMITKRTKMAQNGIWKCSWVVFETTRKRNIIDTISYGWKDGYVVYDEPQTRKDYRGGLFKTQGYWFHAETLAEARSHAKAYAATPHLTDRQVKAYYKALEEMRKADMRDKANELRNEEKKTKAAMQSEELKEALAYEYCYADSIKAGNCVPGTNMFIADHNLCKTDHKSGSFLLRIARGTWQFGNVKMMVLRHMGLNAHEGDATYYSRAIDRLFNNYSKKKN